MTRQEIDSFHQFATSQLDFDEPDELSLDEVFDLWRIANPSSTEMSECVASMRRGMADIEAGRVFSARAVIAELRGKLAVGPRS
jgi:hypothetical protein